MTLTMGKTFTAIPAALVLGIAGLAFEAVERLNCWRRARRERDQLLGLNERELHDIGISRVDALREASRPLMAGCGARDFDPRRPQP